MKTATFVLTIMSVALSPFWTSASAREPLSKDARRAFAQGAIIEIDLRVVDSTGTMI